MNANVAAPMPAAEVSSLGGRTIRRLLFLLAAVPVGAVAFGILVAGWIAVAVVSITPLVVPALRALRAAVGGLARADAGLANALLGTATRPDVTSPGPTGYWRNAGNILGDGAFWRQQSYLLVRLSLGFAFALFEWTLLAASLGLIALPIWYRWGHPELWNNWKIDTVGRAFLAVPVGVAGLAVAVALINPLASASRSLVVGLLRGADATQAAPEVRRRSRLQALALHGVAYGLVNALLILLWALTGRGYFWPEWTLIALGLPLALHAWVVLVDDRPEVARTLRLPRELAMHAGPSVAFAIFFVLVWAVTGGGLLLARLDDARRSGILVPRVTRRSRSPSGGGPASARLEETRAGAVDQQETQSCADRARPARRRPGAARRTRHEPRAWPSRSSTPIRRRRSELLGGGAARDARGARGAAQPCARHPSAGARRPRARGGDRRTRRAHAAPTSASPSTSRTGRRAQSRRPRTSSSPSRSPTRASTRERSGSTSPCDARATGSSSRWSTTAVVAPIPGAAACAGLHVASRRSTGALEVVSPAGGPTTIRAVIPCGS